MQSKKVLVENYFVKFGKKHMSRIGNTPIQIPSTVTVTKDGKITTVKGPKGELSITVPIGVTVIIGEKEVKIESKGADKKSRAIHGFVRSKINNDVVGVTKEWSKTLELSGVGYRANITGSDLVLTIGFSHPVTIHPPQGITFSVVEGKIVVSGIDKHLVGQIAANVRAMKKPEPYKGKGILYSGEHIRKKAGKAAKAVGGALGTAGGK